MAFQPKMALVRPMVLQRVLFVGLNFRRESILWLTGDGMTCDGVRIQRAVHLMVFPSGKEKEATPSHKPDVNLRERVLFMVFQPKMALVRPLPMVLQRVLFVGLNFRRESILWLTGDGMTCDGVRIQRSVHLMVFPSGKEKEVTPSHKPDVNLSERVLFMVFQPKMALVRPMVLQRVLFVGLNFRRESILWLTGDGMTCDGVRIQRSVHLMVFPSGKEKEVTPSHKPDVNLSKRVLFMAFQPKMALVRPLPMVLQRVLFVGLNFRRESILWLTGDGMTCDGVRIQRSVHLMVFPSGKEKEVTPSHKPDVNLSVVQ